jgi:hypothetical protein
MFRFKNKTAEQVRVIRKTLTALCLVWGAETLAVGTMTDNENAICQQIWEKMLEHNSSEEIALWVRQTISDCIWHLKES